MKFRHDICRERERERREHTYLTDMFLLPLKGGGLLDSLPVVAQ